ncbi:MAG: FAD-dependent thymidylate synthase [Desulfurococcaceae archaeon]
MSNEMYSLVKPFVKIITYLNNSSTLIASAGKSTITPKLVDSIISEMNLEDVNKWLKELIRKGHSSPFEHSLYVFEVTCSRVASHQIVRHRIASYTQLSQRYSDKYLRKLVYKISDVMNIDLKNRGDKNNYEEYVRILSKFMNEELSFNKLLYVVSEAFIIPPLIISTKDIVFLKNLLNSVYNYYLLLSRGLSYEDARYILPQCVKTRLLITMNARELYENFLPLRMCSRAQWEIRYIAWIIWRHLVNIQPELFSYTGPRCINIDLKVSNKTCCLNEYLNRDCKFTIERCPESIVNENIVNCIKNASRDPWSGEYLYIISRVSF